MASPAARLEVGRRSVGDVRVNVVEVGAEAVAAQLTLSHVGPAPFHDLVDHQHDELRAPRPARPGAGQKRGVRVGEVAFERLPLWRAERARRAASASTRATIGVPTWGSSATLMWTIPKSSLWLRAERAAC
jgi:hypothetical protein